MRILTLALMLTWALSAQSYEIYYKTFYYPSATIAEQIATHQVDRTLEVCCEFPTKSDAINLKSSGITHLKVHAYHMPTEEQIRTLDSLGITYEAVIEEIFPADYEIARINNSKIQKLTIKQWNFPTYDEVNAYNQFTVNFQLDIDYPEYPLPEHMRIINVLKPEFRVGFSNRVLPGPGYANFFNGLRTKKHFVALEQFPWGVDPQGFNALQRSTLEISPDEKLMPQDIQYLNAFNVAPLLHLRDQAPLDEHFYGLMGKIKAKNIRLYDNGTGELLNSTNTTRINAITSPVSVVLNHFR